MTQISQQSMAEFIAAQRAKRLAAASTTAPITWNEQQLQAIELGRAKPLKSFCITGAAGTGKSTVTAEVLRPLLQTTKLQESTKYLKLGTPGIAIVAFTRRATNNIRKMVAKELQGNVITIHKILEFSKVKNEIWNDEEGEMITKWNFEPMRNAENPLPSSLKVIVVDESSTLGMSLWEKLLAAAPHCEFIFIGDINQLQPVGDESSFGYKLLELPTVELTHVYRQALESKPLALAHRVLSGKPIMTKELREEWGKHEDLSIKIFQKGTHWQDALGAAVATLKAEFAAGTYDPNEDIVLCPFNKTFGTIELNKWILDFAYPDREVHEIIAGEIELYLALEDRVLFNKEEFIVEKISRNAAYSGREPTDVPVDRWGRLKKGAKGFHDHSGKIAADDFEFALSQMGVGEESEEGTRQASHVIYLRSCEYPEQAAIAVSSVGDMKAIDFAHCTTVHKAQGSGWQRVWLLLHSKHNIALCRELLYTGITRTKKKLTIFCEQDTFVKGITSARIPGVTAKEKAAFFVQKSREKAAQAKSEQMEESED